MKRVTLAYLAAALLLLGFAFGPRLGGEFVWDDAYLVEKSPQVASPHGLWPLLTRDLWGAATGEPTQLYHPVPMATIWAEAQLHGMRLEVFRATNVLLHAGCGLLILVWALRQKWPRWMALFAALVFVVHPSVTEPVAWITGRHDLLGLLFVLGAIVVWPIPGDRRAVPRAVAAAALSGLAFLSKEPYIVGPALLAMYQLRMRFDRSATLLALPIAGVGAAIGLRLHFGIPLGSAQIHAPVAEHVLNYATILRHYAEQIVTFSNGRTTENYVALGPASAALVLAMLAGVLVFLSVLTRKGQDDARGALFGVMWMIVALLPYVVAMPVIGMFGNRYAYLPLVGFVVALAHGAHAVAGVVSRPIRETAAWAACGAVALLAVRTAAEAVPWKSDLTLFGADVAEAPDDPKSLYHFAQAVWRHDGCSAALPLYDRAVYADPGYQRAWHNIAGCLIDEHRYDAAVPPAMRAARLAPGSARDEYNLGVALALSGRTSEGIEHLERALALAPGYAAAQAFLVEVRAHPGQTVE